MASLSSGFGPQSLAVFVPGTKTKLRACGFEIVCKFVPGFVSNAYVETHGGIRQQDGQNRRPNWNQLDCRHDKRERKSGNKVPPDFLQILLYYVLIFANSCEKATHYHDGTQQVKTGGASRTCRVTNTTHRADNFCIRYSHIPN